MFRAHAIRRSTIFGLLLLAFGLLLTRARSAPPAEGEALRLDVARPAVPLAAASIPEPVSPPDSPSSEDAYRRLERIASDAERCREMIPELERTAEADGTLDSVRCLAVWGLAQAGRLDRVERFAGPSYPSDVRRTAAVMLQAYGARD